MELPEAEWVAREGALFVRVISEIIILGQGRMEEGPTVSTSAIARLSPFGGLA
jgi:hypothetical protein